ncbi:MAG: hypothetical protein WKF84_23040 [Pyrinomonadaceae bacterium]
MRTELHQTEELSRAIIKIQASVLALVCAIIGGAGLFIVTIWLLIKDGPNVGQHLNLLSHYFWGYLGNLERKPIGALLGRLGGRRRGPDHRAHLQLHCEHTAPITSPSLLREFTRYA